MTFLDPLFDCELLDRAFTASTLPWTDEQKAAVTGHASLRVLQTERHAVSESAGDQLRSRRAPGRGHLRPQDESHRRALHVSGQHGERVRPRSANRVSRAGRSTTSASSTGCALSMKEKSTSISSSI